MKLFVRFLLPCLGAWLSGLPDARAATAATNADWPTYLGGKDRSLYSPLRQIEHTRGRQ